jgi:hypothetical protein
VRDLRHCHTDLRNELKALKTFRRQEMLGLKRAPAEVAIERNTWFHVGANANQQFVYCLLRMLEPIKEHVDNNFNPLPEAYANEFEQVRRKINDLMQQSRTAIDTTTLRATEHPAEADMCKDELSTSASATSTACKPLPTAACYRCRWFISTCCKRVRSF